MPRTDGLVRLLFPSPEEVARAMTKDLSEIAGISSRTGPGGTQVETMRFKNGGVLVRYYHPDGRPPTYKATEVNSKPAAMTSSSLRCDPA